MIPLGLIAAVVYSAVFAGVMRRWGRMAGFAAVVGWLIGEVGSLLWNPGGDLLLAGDGFGYGFLLLCTGAVVVAASLDPRPTSSSSRRWWNRLRRHDR
jgi:hypothetical protein